MSHAIDVRSSRGSIWHRWDPHIHAPGTLLNDQFGGRGALEEFLTRIESVEPSIRALGVTDYCGIDCYERVMAAKQAGRLPGVGLIFPNVELRFSIETSKGGAVNVHLLFSPEADDHISQIRRFLSNLKFKFGKEFFQCTREDLIRLGKAYDAKATSETAALHCGSNQFKVDYQQLSTEWHASQWVQSNGLIAVSGGDRDGTGGLRDSSGSFGALRKSLEAAAHIIFSSSPSQVDFWLGKGAASVDELESVWGGKKPCLHGSDAHEQSRVGNPDKERYCWLKGDLTFETLQQACIEPEGRVWIGPTPPRGGLPSQTVTELEVLNAPWLDKNKVLLNSGLIAVIGARGSGKTALADLIAAAAYSLSPHLGQSSFIKRARSHLVDCSSSLTWESGEQTSNALSAIEIEDIVDSPRIKYLSQQFVEQLCSAEGVKDELLAEIKRVIFQAHPIEDRLGAETFDELLVLRTARALASREREEHNLRAATDELTEERARKAAKPSLLKQQSELTVSIKKDKADRESLIGKGQEVRVARLAEITEALDAKRLMVDEAKRRQQELLALKDDLEDLKETRTPEWIEHIRQERADAGLSENQWDSVEMDYTTDVVGLIARHIEAVQKDIPRLSGPLAGEVVPDLAAPPLTTSYINVNADLQTLTLSLLEKEQTRLRRLVGIDAANARKFAALSDKISRNEISLRKLGRDIERAGQAEANIKVAIERARKAYEGIFEQLINEERELARLYAPLAQHLAAQPDSLSKLTFTVRRIVDVDKWASAGEELLDLRIQGPFKGKGSLLAAANALLRAPWESGAASDVSAAMATFRDMYSLGLIEHAPIARSDQVRFRSWMQSVSKWLYSTDHVSVSYSVQYDGMEIEQLSPGTRGIVLLLLYLAIDGDDDRPLLIDQPEENLDPQSIYKELVHRFRDAKARRQIIIVTHNANLVVNTDADQVVVAMCGPHRPGKLPVICYESGGLENPMIRKHVCDILEGGETAFRERAKRLRVKLS